MIPCPLCGKEPILLDTTAYCDQGHIMLDYRITAWDLIFELFSAEEIQKMAEDLKIEEEPDKEVASLTFTTILSQEAVVRKRQQRLNDGAPPLVEMLLMAARNPQALVVVDAIRKVDKKTTKLLCIRGSSCIPLAELILEGDFLHDYTLLEHSEEAKVPEIPVKSSV